MEFGRSASRLLDVGCGAGEFIIAYATVHPETDCLGIDILSHAIQRASAAVERESLKNCRFISCDAVSFIRDSVDENSLDEIHLYHPQPYFDETEAHFGMLTADFVSRVRTILKPSGRFYLQTDNEPYGRYILSVLEPFFYCEVRREGWPDAPKGRTRREAHAIRKKLDIIRVVAFPREIPLDLPLPQPYFHRPGIRRRRLPRKLRKKNRPE